MSTKPRPTNSADDNLESLAEDLLGIDLHSSLPEVEPFEVEEFDLEEEEVDNGPALPRDEAEATVEPPPSVADVPVTARPRRTYIDDDDDFGSSILDEEEEPESRETAAVSTGTEWADVPEEVFEEVLEDVAVDEELETEVEDAEPASAEEDTYWDALDGWDWEEESAPATAEKRPPPTTPSQPRVPRADVTASEPPRKTSEFRDDSDFGAGLDETQTPPRVAQEKEAEPRRRSRRRRRSGKDPERQISAADRVRSTAPPAESPRPAVRSSIRESEPEPDEDEDGFGAGLEIREQEGEEPRKRGRSRRRRRKSADRTSSESTAIPATSRAEQPAASERRAADDEVPETEDGPDAARKYRNVPTWEEAISFLVRPSTRRSGSDGGSSEGQRRGGRGRSGSRRGGRRGGRKSGGS